MERADWAAAAALEVTTTQYPQADALTRFARGLALARTRDVRGAKREVEALDALRAALEKSGDSYWANRVQEQRQTVLAWMAYADGAARQRSA